jgi:uncharacterized protein
MAPAPQLVASDGARSLGEHNLPSDGSLHRRRIAVIGGGAAGLTAAYALQRNCDVTLYEAAKRLGGHVYTCEVLSDNGATLFIDTGFVVYNEGTYPTLHRLFRELGISTQATEMSMSIRCDGCGLEYAGGRGLTGLFPQSTCLVRRPYLYMLAEIPRFRRHARHLLVKERDRQIEDVTLAQFLAVGGYSAYFVDHFLIPLISTVWTCPPAIVDLMPAAYVFAFLRDHGMLSIGGTSGWRTVEGGARTYVDCLIRELARVRAAAPVLSVRRLSRGVELHYATGDTETFDGAVIATHADQALAILEKPTSIEAEILGAFRYSSSSAYLHTDSTLLPRASAAHASWNYYIPSCGSRRPDVKVTYNMTRLQKLAVDDHYLVTLNSEVDRKRVVATIGFEHPIYTCPAVLAQRRLPTLNDGVLAFAGSYHGWGFHEDACRSGLNAARSLGAAW